MGCMFVCVCACLRQLVSARVLLMQADVVYDRVVRPSIFRVCGRGGFGEMYMRVCMSNNVYVYVT